jgi:uncharacterized protein YecA (UPF0149 family)
MLADIVPALHAASIEFDAAQAPSPFSILDQPYVRTTPKIGRNEPCPCGSGKKYKKCCSNRLEQDQ